MKQNTCKFVSFTSALIKSVPVQQVVHQEQLLRFGRVYYSPYSLGDVESLAQDALCIYGSIAMELFKGKFTAVPNENPDDVTLKIIIQVLKGNSTEAEWVGSERVSITLV